MGEAGGIPYSYPSGPSADGGIALRPLKVSKNFVTWDFVIIFFLFYCPDDILIVCPLYFNGN